jgi:DNA-binding response OmpR family regulator
MFPSFFLTENDFSAALNCIATQEEFDLILLDLIMPGIGGMEVLETLSQQTPDTVVILLTAHASMNTVIDAFRKGAHDYLFKPCQTVELRESVRAGLLKRRRSLAQRELLTRLQTGLEEIRALQVKKPPVLLPDSSHPEGERDFLRWNGLIVDVIRHVVTLDGHLLEISPTEFSLLAYLVNEAPRVVSPEELWREVSGYAESWDPQDAVRHHIYRIRRKIKMAVEDSDVLKTIRGVGYTLGE